jgi:hypothetical protein
MARSVPTRAELLGLYRDLLREAQRFPSIKRAAILEDIRIGAPPACGGRHMRRRVDGATSSSLPFLSHPPPALALQSGARRRR